MLAELDLSPGEFESGEAADVFSGNRLLSGMDPFAMCYGGHQFGNWAGQLGDGRAINLGEVVNGRGQRWMLQLKGAGPTPYSRTADGLAVLRSSLREFVCSEAMHHLGIPTTRALCLTSTGERVVRDMFYDGNPREEPGAIVCRVAPSFTRFGNFQIPAARKELDLLKRLVDYTIETDSSEFRGQLSDEVRGEWFRSVCERTADLVVHWMRVGFVHGVMNTDNMSITGLTIDYGPYGWLEGYDPEWTPNTTDASGRRYCYGRQPQIALWNLVQLANALHGIVGDERVLQGGIDAYVARFNSGCRRMMAGKLGLLVEGNGEPAEAVSELSDSLLGLLQRTETDMTIFFRALASVELCGSGELDDGGWSVVLDGISGAWYRPADVSERLRGDYIAWFRLYRQLLGASGVSEQARREQMNGLNPKYVFRNYLHSWRLTGRSREM
jgi:uncharacterized protein YdiU (UPF0061 family)